MAVRDEIKEQTDKFKDMTFAQKRDYIWTYYKWWIIIAVASVFFIVSLINTIKRNSRPVYISAAFINSTLEAAGANCTLEDEFLDEVGASKDTYNSEFDYAIYLDNDYGNQQSMAGQVKLISKYSAEELDIVCAPEEVLEGSGDVGGYSNLEEILPAKMLDDLKNKGYEFYYYTEKIYADDATMDENGNMPYTAGETYMAGIYLDNCKKLVGDLDTCVYSNDVPDRMILTLAWNAPHLDHAIEFIEFVIE